MGSFASPPLAKQGTLEMAGQRIASSRLSRRGSHPSTRELLKRPPSVLLAPPGPGAEEVCLRASARVRRRSIVRAACSRLPSAVCWSMRSATPSMSGSRPRSAPSAGRRPPSLALGSARFSFDKVGESFVTRARVVGGGEERGAPVSRKRRCCAREFAADMAMQAFRSPAVAKGG
jgi:hypothetical protein